MRDLSHPKFKKLAEIEGYDDPIELLADATADSVCMPIPLGPAPAKKPTMDQ